MHDLKRYPWLSVLVMLTLAFEGEVSLAKGAAKNEVLINGMTVEPDRNEPSAPGQQEEVRQRKWVVKFTGPVRETDKREIEALGCSIHEYIPDFAFLTTMTQEVKKKVEALSFVAGVALFRPEHKLNEKLRKLSVQQQGEAPLRLQLKLDAASSLKPVTARVQRLKGKIQDVGVDSLRVEVPAKAIATLAAMDAVLWITEHVDMRLVNDAACWVVQSNTPNGMAIWDRGIHGEGMIVGIGDSGLDYDTPWARDPANAIGSAHRKVVGYDTTYGDDYDADNPGHGTHVFGTVAGDRTPVDNLTTANGMAPKAKVFLQDLTPGGGSSVFPPSDLGLLFSTAYQAGARLHTDSWGNSDTSYSFFAQSADRYLWEHKDFLALFANGNNGPGGGTVGNPATAKNVISVGASLNGSSAESMAYFSSRGPTRDGRVKPTVTAPGEGVRSADSDGVKNSFNSGIISMSGTSMATPSVAGAAALVRQYFVQGFYPLGVAAPDQALLPSAALLKAVLINSAQEMNGSGTDGNIPSSGQGWGRVNLSQVLPFAADAGRLAVASVEPGLATGESWSREYVVPPGHPLKVTLVWTDYPGSIGAAKALVNDLDLSVTTPDGSILSGNAFASGVSYAGGTPDRVNVEEQVLVQAPQSGTYTVTVSGYNIPYGPQPFALAITGVSGVTSTGTVRLDRGSYRTGGSMTIQVADRDLNLTPLSQDETTVQVKSQGTQDIETVTLRETTAESSIFSGELSLVAGEAATGDGRLQVNNGDSITATYRDASGSGGGEANVTATAVVDDTAPVCSGLGVSDVGETGATVSWTTNEPADSLLQYGPTPPFAAEVADQRLSTGHRILLTGLREKSSYAFTARSVDEAGNSGSCSASFTTLSLPPALSVNSSEGETTYRSSTVISGTSSDPSGVSSVTVNGTLVPRRASDGYYETEVQLQMGSNHFLVSAADTAGNTTQAQLTVTRRSPPDLFMMLVRAPATAEQGAVISVTDTVCNKGGGDAAAFRVGFYLSNDQQYSSDDLLIGSRSVDSSAAGACSEGTSQLMVPSTAPGGSFYIIAFADYQGVSDDADRGNNTLSGNLVTLPNALLKAPASIVVPETNSTGIIRVTWGTSNVSESSYILETSFNEGSWAEVARTVTSYADVSVQANGSYRFRVKAVKASYADSGYTTSANPCVVTLVCGAPARVLAPANSSTGIFRISWGPSSVNGVNYLLEYSVNGGSWLPAASTAATYADFVAGSSGSYLFRVKAVKDGYGHSSYTLSDNCAVTLTCGAPGVVNVPASNSDGLVKLGWGPSDVSGVTYLVEYSVNGGGWSPVGSTTGTLLTYTATSNGSYSFRVMARKTGYSDSSYKAAANPCVVTLVCGAPARVLAPASSSTGIFRISWGPSSLTGVNYLLEYSVNGGSWLPAASTAATYADFVAGSSGSYLFRVKAVKDGYGQSNYTLSDNCVVALTCGAPGVVSVPASNSDGLVKLGWGPSDVSGVTYLVEYSVNGGGWSPVGSTTGTLLTYTATSSGSYSFRVMARKTGYSDSSYKAAANPCVVTLVCGAPARVLAPASSSTGIFRISWGPSSVNGVNYLLEYSVNGGSWLPAASTAATVADFVAGSSGSYRFRVKAVKDGYGQSSYTLSGNCAVTLTCGAPGVVSVPATNSDGLVKLGWGPSDVSGVTYLVEYSVNGGGWSPVGSTTGTLLTYTATSSGSYSFRVMARKTGYSDSSYKAAANPCVVTLVCGAPARVLAPASSTTGIFRISWGPSSVTGVNYLLEYSVNGGSWLPAASTAATYADFVAGSSGGYLFRVKAVRDGYGQSSYTLSGNCGVTLTCGAPSVVSVPATNSDGLVKLGWGPSDVSGVTYLVEYSVNGGGWSPVGSTTGTLLTYTATSNGSYRFRVKAVKPGFADSPYTTAATSCNVTI